MTDDVIARKDALLEATLPNVLFDGWSPAALKAGAASLGLDEADLPILFPDGAAELRLWLDDWADRKMVERLAATDLAGLRTHQRIAVGLKARFAVLGPYREAVRRALAARFSPMGTVQAAQAVYRTVDEIWYAAGDSSTDFSFYTKRGLLATVYTSAMLYWLNDESEDSADTGDFIDRRLADVLKLPSLGRAAQDALRKVTAPFDLLRREARR